MAGRPRQVVALSAAAVLLNALGNCCLSLGMRSKDATDYAGAMTNPWVIAGIVLLIGWLLSQLSLLSWADLTYVLPITAASYVGSALLGATVLHEHVKPARWAGIALIAAGIIVVGRTRHRTGPVK
jgi:drug/metabolite transporter (DMT)-like permease